MKIQVCSNHEPWGHKWGHAQGSNFNICL